MSWKVRVTVTLLQLFFQSEAVLKVTESYILSNMSETMKVKSCCYYKPLVWSLYDS